MENKNQVKNKVAMARIVGGPLAPRVRGIVTFRDAPRGTNVCVEVTGLPAFQRMPNEPSIGPHGFHIHEFGNCSVGNKEDPFQAAGGHWNPDNQPHGNHAGDFPVLFSNNGLSRMCFYTNRFKINEIIDRSILIHESPDDYRTEPAGRSGRRLACGIIRFATEVEDISGNF